MDETDSLIAFSFLFFVVGAFRGLKTLLKVFERAIEFITRGEVNSDNLVNTN